MAKQKSIHITDIKQLQGITFAGRVLAELRGVTARSIERAADPDDENYIGIKRIEKGKYEARHSLFVMFKDLSRQIEDAKNSSSDAKEENYRLDARRKKLELAEREKELIKVDDFCLALEKISSTFKNKFPPTRKELATKILFSKDYKEAEKQLEKRDSELLNEFATTIENIIRGMVDSSDKADSHTRSAKISRRTKA